MSAAARDQRLRVAIATRNPSDPALASWLAPEYPGASLAQACALRRGESPAALAAQADPEARLSRADAHAWLSDMPGRAPLAWYCARAGLPALRAWAIARWAIAVLARPAEREALYRERVFDGPGGARCRGRFVDRIDEIQAGDLAGGTRTGVRTAFESAARRAGEAYLARVRTDQRLLSSEPDWRLPRPGPRSQSSARWLLTGAELAREGDELRHCVGGYASAVESGASAILALCVRGHRSTVEIRRSDGVVLQHHGPSNKRPHALCVRWVRVACRRAGLLAPDES